jgi:DNA polymerase-3 subunit gamma/tau
VSSTYVPLARKWRPKTFADVVGQEEIVRALSNAVAQDRLAHAYLFSGQRGVGKTTTARLLASAINCRSFDRPTPTPCGTCESCVEIHEGRSIDAHEIDGATHGKVDQARDLIEVVAYAPVRDRRKVFIIDEVHAISSAAFQALLKTLEEPPPHVVFILATTERQKIPATILSRCQRFEFRRLTDEEVAERLADIAKREGFALEGEKTAGKADGKAKAGALTIEKGALAALAAAATGSMRDALSLFDQAVARVGEAGTTLTTTDVDALLGAPDRSRLLALLESVLAADRAAVLKGAAELEASGTEARTTIHDMTALARGMLRLAADPSSLPPSGLSEDAAARLGELAKATPYATLLRVLTMLVEETAEIRRSDVPSLACEVLLLRLAELPRLVPIEELLAGGGSLPAAPAAPAPSPRSAPAPPAPAPAAAPKTPARSHAEPAPAPARRSAEPEAPRFTGLAPLAIEPDPLPEERRGAAFREAVEKRQAQLAAVLEDVRVDVEGASVRIVVDPPNAVLEKRLSEPSIVKTLEEAAVSTFGRSARVSIEGASPARGDLTAAAANADPEALEKELLKQRVASDEHVKKMLDLFGGEIADVRRPTDGDA